MMRSFICGVLVIGAMLGGAVPLLAGPANDESELFFVTQKAFDDGFYDVSLRYIDQFLAQYPSSAYVPKAKLLQGQCYFFKSQYLKAFDIFQKISSTYTELKDATFFWLGETYLKASDYRQAVTFYQRVIEECPDSPYVPQAVYSLGWAFLEQAKYAEAAAAFQRVITEYPQHALAEDSLFRWAEVLINLDKKEEATGLLERYLREFPGAANAGKAFFYIGENLYFLNDPLTAVTYYAKAGEADNPPQIKMMAEIGMGWSYIRLKKYDLARERFAAAEGLITRHGLASMDEVYFGEAALYANEQKVDEAIARYDLIITKFPESPRLVETYLNKANLLFDNRRYDDALKAFQWVLGYAKNKPVGERLLEQAYYGVAWSYFQLGDVDQAVATFSRVVEGSKNRVVKVSALAQIGDLYHEAGRYQKALEIYDRVLGEFSDSVYADYAQFQQGIALLRLNNLEAAKISLQSLAANFPKSKHIGEAFYYLGIVYFREGVWVQAAESFDRFRTEMPLHHLRPDAEYLLGLSLINQGRYQDAVALFRRILKEGILSGSLVASAELQVAKAVYLLGDLKEAMKLFKGVMERYAGSETHEDALLWLADRYLDGGEFREAIGLYLQFFEKFSSSPRVDLVRYDLGHAFASLGELDKALAYYHEISPEAPDDVYASAQLAIADIFADERNSEKAVAAYREIAETIPAYERAALVKLARVYFAQDRPGDAITVYHQALAASQGDVGPTNAEILFALGDAYEADGQIEQAVDQYFKVVYLASDPDTWTVKAYLRIARIFENQQKWAEARLIYEKLVAFKIEESKYAEERLGWIAEMVE